MFYVLVTFNITGGALLVFIDDELTAFRNKNHRFIFKVAKNKKVYKRRLYPGWAILV